MKVHTVFSLLVIDTPGFQFQPTQNQGVSFHNIFINYLSERLNELFQHRTIVSPREQYLQVSNSFLSSHKVNCANSNSMIHELAYVVTYL